MYCCPGLEEELNWWQKNGLCANNICALFRFMNEIIWKPVSFPNNCRIFHFLCSLSSCSDAKDNSFTRSRSSSVTSIDRESREAISSFHFCESFPRKTDPQVSPCLLVGTTQGSVMMVALSLPPNGDPRLQQPVGITSCGKTQNMDVHFR